MHLTMLLIVMAMAGGKFDLLINMQLWTYYGAVSAEHCLACFAAKSGQST